MTADSLGDQYGVWWWPTGTEDGLMELQSWLGATCGGLTASFCVALNLICFGTRLGHRVAATEKIYLDLVYAPMCCHPY